MNGEWVIPDAERRFSVPATFNLSRTLAIDEVRSTIILPMGATDSSDGVLMMQFMVKDAGGGSSILPPFIVPLNSEGWIGFCELFLDVRGKKFNLPVAIDNCPGCGKDLDGVLAYRGGCYECYPDITKEDEERILGDE